MPYKLFIYAGISLCTGCMIFATGTRNLIHEPIDFFQQQSLTHALRKQAREAWEVFAGVHPEWCTSTDFEDGFIDGFADYLDLGGKGDPPAIPPKRYRKNEYLNPEGFQAIDRYFAGFASGSRAARESGLRDTLVVPVLLPIPAEPTSYPRPTTEEHPPREVPPMSPVIEERSAVSGQRSAGKDR